MDDYDEDLRRQESYERHRARMRERSRQEADAGRNIFPIPKVVSPENKNRARESFQFFCENYFPKQFPLQWSNDHLRAIEKIERAARSGGLFAFAMPRGSGKALSIDTPLKREGGGYILMRDVYEGVRLLDERGRPCRVNYATEIMFDRECYRVSFDNGEEIIADAEHLWQVVDDDGKDVVANTKTLLDSLSYRNIRKAQNVVEPNHIKFDSSPYFFGAFSGITKRDIGSISNKNVPDFSKGLLRRNIRYFYSLYEIERGLKETLVVPASNIEPIATEKILNASKKNQADFLLGVFDATKEYLVDREFIPLEKNKFSDAIISLIISLKLNYSLDAIKNNLFLDRSDIQKILDREIQKDFIRIVSIEKTESVPVRCVQVDSPSKLYLCGKTNIPTHNTTLCETACLWAALYGFHRFVLVVGAESDAASQMFQSIKSEIESNERLYDDFPEVCYPISELNGSSNRASGQHVNGNKTRVKWNSDIAVFPHIVTGETPDGEKVYTPSSGCVVKYAGITGRIRGMKYKIEGGKPVRPSLCIIDDPQTDESARSPQQIRDRLTVVKKTILNLTGPGVKMSAFCPCTIIERNDAADQLVDRRKNPEWQGEKFKAIYQFPSNMDLWNEYADIRAKSFQEGGDGTVATEFYRARRKEMDEGAKVAWPERKNEDDLSSLQFLMNKYLFDKNSFMSEFQQEPFVEAEIDEQLTPGHIFDKLNNRPRYQVPLKCSKLSAFIDVQKNVLFYAVCAWTSDFDGYLIDYGTFPKQSRPIFDLHSLNPSLEDVFPNVAPESRLRLGLEQLTEIILGREYLREDGATTLIGKCFVDANWGNSTGVVYDFCRESPRAAILTPSHGRGYTAKDTPMPFMKRSAGELHGHYWYYPNNRNIRAVRHIIYDTNYWKTFLYNRLLTRQGTSGSFSIFGNDSRDHELLSQHLTAEHWVQTAGRNRVLYEWGLKNGAYRNDWFDCLVGASVAANELGCTRPEFTKVGGSNQRFVSFEELSRIAENGDNGRDEINGSPNDGEEYVSFADLAKRMM